MPADAERDDIGDDTSSDFFTHLKWKAASLASLGFRIAKEAPAA
jgi:hypothetical protein